MKYTKATEVALGAMTELAREGGLLSMTEIIKRTDAPLKFLEQIMLKLKRADLVASIRGRTGGYVLKHAAGDIAVLDVIKATDKHLLVGPDSVLVRKNPQMYAPILLALAELERMAEVKTLSDLAMI